jgi:hypothetical protein
MWHGTVQVPDRPALTTSTDYTAGYKFNSNPGIRKVTVLGNREITNAAICMTEGFTSYARMHAVNMHFNCFL